MTNIFIYDSIVDQVVILNTQQKLIMITYSFLDITIAECKNIAAKRIFEKESEKCSAAGNITDLVVVKGDS